MAATIRIGTCSWADEALSKYWYPKGVAASERLRYYGWPVELEPSHPKMGILVKEVSEQASNILDRKL